MRKKAKKKREWTEEKLTRILAKRYCGSAWAFLPKVRNGTGWQRKARTADAMAMSLWPSRGLHLYGFEIKCARADWWHELNNPDKAEDIFQFCDFWYVVAPPDVVNTEELPKTWGLLEAQKGGKLKTVVEAPTLKPKAVSKLFLAALLRKVTENMPGEKLLEDARKAGVDEGVEIAKEDAERNLRHTERDLKELKDRIAKFEKVTGVQIDNWRPVEAVAQAVRAVLEGEDKDILQRLERVRDNLAELVEQCDRAMGKEKEKKPDA